MTYSALAYDAAGEDGCQPTRGNAPALVGRRGFGVGLAGPAAERAFGSSELMTRRASWCSVRTSRTCRLRVNGTRPFYRLQITPAGRDQACEARSAVSMHTHSHNRDLNSMCTLACTRTTLGNVTGEGNYAYCCNVCILLNSIGQRNGLSTSPQ